MNARRAILMMVVGFGLTACSHRASIAGGVGVSMYAKPPNDTTSISRTDRAFEQYRSPEAVSARARRDIEFHWSKLYEDRGKSLAPTDLNQFARTIADTVVNPIGYEASDVRLLVDFMNFSGVPYNGSPDPQTGPGFVIAPLVTSFGYDTANASHFDTYIYYPGANGDAPELHDRGATWSDFKYAHEDTSTGRDPDINAVLGRNSLSLAGPDTADVGGAWMAPDGGQNWVFAHEAQHCLNAIQPAGPVTEIFSSAVEALVGEAPATPIYDTKFTASLLQAGGNYQAWRTLGAYVVYNFRGVDTTRTLSGESDDLLWRWAHGGGASSPGLGTVASALTDSACLECATKSYFDGLSASDRLELFVHNWRVANYVQNYALAEHQFGYHPLFGFRPDVTVGYWQDVDPSPGSPNNVVIPPEVTIGVEAGLRELNLVRTAYNEAAPADSHAMCLAPRGAEYWVIRSDPELSNSVKQLVVRVSPEGTVTSGTSPCGFHGRVVATLVPYGQDRDEGGTPQPLWAHGEWAGAPLPHQWADVDRPAGPLEFTLPNFGSAWKAAVLVITLGESSTYPLSSYIDLTDVLGYRLNLALKDSTQSGEAQAVAATAAYHDGFPTWSPDGSELAYTGVRAAHYPLSQIYRSVIGSGMEDLVVVPQQERSQSRPDWSPRGDWIAFDQDQGPGDTRCDIWAYNLETSELRHITSRTDSELGACFSPNGQTLLYTRWMPDSTANAGTAEIRRIGLDGAADELVFSRSGLGGVPVARWSADGRSALFVVQDSLYRATEGAGVEFVDHSSGGFVMNEPAAEFDVHRAGGQMVVTENGQVPECGGSGVQTAWRVALRDAASDDSESRFFDRGMRDANPRWSYDGTRLAFTVRRDTTGGDEDVYVGTVSYNYPPYFASPPRDTVFTTCGGLTIDLDATDPDGEAVKYRGAYVPAGASLDSTTGVLTWDPPLSGDHYLVFRALDASRGLAQKVVKISVPDSVRPARVENLAAEFVSFHSVGLTFIAVADDSLEDEGAACKYVLKRHTQTITESNWNSATTVNVPDPPDDPGNEEIIQVTGLQSNTTYYFAIKTRDEAGDHLSAISNVASAHTLSGGGGGGGLSSRPAGPGEVSVRGVQAFSSSAPRQAEAAALKPSTQAMAAELATSGDALSWRLYRVSQEETSSIAGLGGEPRLVLQAPEREGWKTRASFALAPDCSLFALRVPRSERARAVVAGGYELVMAAAEARGGAKATHGVRAAAADHNRLGSLLDDLAPSQGTIEIDSGDTLGVRYEAMDAEASPVDWFLLFHRSGGGVAKAAVTGGAVDLPASFALEQNRPNPFSSLTTIRFALPGPEHVRLEIYDLAGRRVATPADGSFPAGFHAIAWDRRTQGGRTMQPGVYLYRIDAGEFHDQRKLILLP